jgi:hypothetical protein
VNALFMLVLVLCGLCRIVMHPIMLCDRKVQGLRVEQSLGYTMWIVTKLVPLKL